MDGTYLSVKECPLTSTKLHYRTSLGLPVRDVFGQSSPFGLLGRWGARREAPASDAEDAQTGLLVRELNSCNDLRPGTPLAFRWRSRPPVP